MNRFSDKISGFLRDFQDFHKEFSSFWAILLNPAGFVSDSPPISMQFSGFSRIFETFASNFQDFLGNFRDKLRFSGFSERIFEFLKDSQESCRIFSDFQRYKSQIKYVESN